MHDPYEARDPYEASVAAAAFFAFGAEYARQHSAGNRARRSQAPPADAVSFASYSQTPLDALFGDSAFGVNGRHLLIEFKRDEDQLRTELKKPRRERLAQFALGDNPLVETIKELARNGHRFVFGASAGPVQEGESAKFDLITVPYLSTIVALNTGTQPDASDRTTLQDLTARLLMPRNSAWMARVRSQLRLLPGLSLDEMSDYLGVVLDPDETGSFDDGGPSRAGVWVGMSSDGRVAFGAYECDGDLQRLERLALEALSAKPRVRQPDRGDGPPQPGQEPPGQNGPIR